MMDSSLPAPRSTHEVLTPGPVLLSRTIEGV